MLILSVSVCAVSNIAYQFMLVIRLYIFVLTSLFLVLVVAQRGLGILEAVVITCAMLYLILDVRTELQQVKGNLQLLEKLEERLSLLLRS
jgi:hypothetical protein